MLVQEKLDELHFVVANIHFPWVENFFASKCVHEFSITKNRPEERHYPHTIDADKIGLPITAYGSTANSPRQSHRVRTRWTKPNHLNHNKKAAQLTASVLWAVWNRTLTRILLGLYHKQPLGRGLGGESLFGSRSKRLTYPRAHVCGWGQVRIISCCCPHLAYELTSTN